MPKPARPGGIPIWIGGHTAAALKRAGELGNGWHPIGMRPPALLDPEEYGDKARTVREWARRAGRDPKAVALTFRAPLEILPGRARPPAADRLRFRGTPEQVLEDIRAYQAVGVSHFVFDPVTRDARGFVAQMERFARQVRPRLSRRVSN